MMRKLKPFKQVIEEGDFRKTCDGYADYDGFFISENMEQYFGKYIDVAPYSGSNGDVFIGPKEEEFVNRWSFKPEFFEEPEFLSKEDFKL